MGVPPYKKVSSVETFSRDPQELHLTGTGLLPISVFLIGQNCLVVLYRWEKDDETAVAFL